MSFINPLFLFAVSAAVLPVLYHLVRRMRAKKVMFSSLMFLKATPRELVKRRRFRDVLLMAVRAAMFALLALAFARPFLPDNLLPFVAAEEAQSVVVLLDRSYSMQVGDRFEEAKAEILRRLDDAGRGDEFAVVAFSDVVQQLTPLGDDLALHRNVLGTSLQADFRPTDVYKSLRQAEEILAEAHNERRTIVLVSDFQANGWSGAFDNWKLDPTITFETVPVGDGEVANASIDAFNLTRKRTGDRTAIRYDTRVQTRGRRDGDRNVARLTVAGAVVGEQAVPPVDAGQVTFQQEALRPGVYQGEITLDDDALAVDNRYYFTYTVADRSALLVVDEAPGNTRRDAFFLGNMFDLGEDALYRFSTGGRGRLTAGELKNYQVVFLTNVSTLNGPQVGTLRQFVEEGGSLVVSFGENVDLASFSQVLQDFGIGRVTGPVNPRTVQGQDAIIGEVDLRHPIFTLFAAAGSGGIFRPIFRRYARVVPDSGAVVLGRYDTKDPFLLERRRGQGTVLVYTSTFNTAWTDFPVNELYVPFVYQLVRYGLREASARTQFTVGEVVSLPGRPGEEWEVRTPDDGLFKVPVEAGATGYFRETVRPGHYTAQRGREQFYFSVNVDARESDLQPRDVEEAYAAVVPPTDPLTADPAMASALALDEAERDQKFWRVLILLLVALFAFETYYANRWRKT